MEKLKENVLENQNTIWNTNIYTQVMHAVIIIINRLHTSTRRQNVRPNFFFFQKNRIHSTVHYGKKRMGECTWDSWSCCINITYSCYFIQLNLNPWNGGSHLEQVLPCYLIQSRISFTGISRKLLLGG